MSSTLLCQRCRGQNNFGRVLRQETAVRAEGCVGYQVSDTVYVCMYVCKCTFLFVCMFAYLFVYVCSLRLSVCLSKCLSVSSRFCLFLFLNWLQLESADIYSVAKLAGCIINKLFFLWFTSNCDLFSSNAISIFLHARWSEDDEEMLCIMEKTKMVIMITWGR